MPSRVISWMTSTNALSMEPASMACHALVFFPRADCIMGNRYPTGTISSRLTAMASRLWGSSRRMAEKSPRMSDHSPPFTESACLALPMSSRR